MTWMKTVQNDLDSHGLSCLNRHSRPGPEPTTLEAVGNQWRYALVVVQAGEEEEAVIVKFFCRIHCIGPGTYTQYNNTRNSAVADKPRDAFVQMQ